MKGGYKAGDLWNATVSIFTIAPNVVSTSKFSKSYDIKRYTELNLILHVIDSCFPKK